MAIHQVECIGLLFQAGLEGGTDIVGSYHSVKIECDCGESKMIERKVQYRSEYDEQKPLLNAEEVKAANERQAAKLAAWKTRRWKRSA